ncbi:MAG TPA: hypothetical protein VE957_01420 [Terriglobales bacterium]|nr:hypothetical protein [Terriglobales bacterium]
MQSSPRFNPCQQRFPYVLKLGDIEDFFGELGGNFWFSGQGFDEILKSGCVHIRAALGLGYGGLADTENLGEMELRGPKAGPSLRSG